MQRLSDGLSCMCLKEKGVSEDIEFGYEIREVVLGRQFGMFF